MRRDRTHRRKPTPLRLEVEPMRRECPLARPARNIVAPAGDRRHLG